MASTLQFSNNLPLASSPFKPHAPRPKLQLSFTTRATEPETPPSEQGSETAGSEPDAFDNRLTRFQLRSGKKAEARKARQAAKRSRSVGGGMYLPAVPLKEPVAGGMKVDFGFSPFSERINGRMAMLGLTALILVELATGKGVINYHTPGIVLLQLYFVAAVAAVYLKYEKEKIGVWPSNNNKK